MSEPVLGDAVVTLESYYEERTKRMVLEEKVRGLEALIEELRSQRRPAALPAPGTPGFALLARAAAANAEPDEATESPQEEKRENVTWFRSAGVRGSRSDQLSAEMEELQTEA